MPKLGLQFLSFRLSVLLKGVLLFVALFAIYRYVSGKYSRNAIPVILTILPILYNGLFRFHPVVYIDNAFTITYKGNFFKI